MSTTTTTWQITTPPKNRQILIVATLAYTSDPDYNRRNTLSHELYSGAVICLNDVWCDCYEDPILESDDTLIIHAWIDLPDLSFKPGSTLAQIYNETY